MLTENEIARREAELLAQEAAQPRAWWWLSFCDPDRPEGSRFVGACLVRARGILTATREAHRLGCNPGGEVMAAGPIPLTADIVSKWTERLLSHAECEAFDREGVGR